MCLDNYYPTGNEYISIPTIREDAAIESVNFLHMGYRGLVEICGEPLFKPVVFVDGIEKEIVDIKWTRDNYWIPRFTGKVEELEISGVICAPRGHRGFIYKIEIKNNSSNRAVTFGLKGNWNKTLHSINESKNIDGRKNIYYSNWTKGPVFDFKNGITLFSFGFISDVSLDLIEWNAGEEKNENIDITSKETVNYIVGKSFKLDKNEAKEITLYFGFGIEEVGAATSAIEMMRQGGDHLIEETNDWLKSRIKNSGDSVIDNVLNLNLFFNYFYASGKTIDTEEVVLVTSRSPRYYVSAAYWDRDSLLWSFPALLITDMEFGEEVLGYVFKTQIKNVGIHSRYIDGTVLEPGFELDELCAPIIALKTYIDFTNDFSILKKPYMKNGIEIIMKRLKAKKHPEINLYETFLQPTDDMRVYPYLTYNNVLVWKVFQIMKEFSIYYGESYKAKEYENLSQNVNKDILAHCVIYKDDKPIFAWAVDLIGNSTIYDEPPGSLTLLSYYGFISKDNDLFINTFNSIYSQEFKHYFNSCEYEELGCSHADHPWILSVANSLLNGRKEQALDILRRTPLDNGIACESIDENTGKCTTGAHFATCAGFLSYAIYKACILDELEEKI
jgi:transposase-like protein